MTARLAPHDDVAARTADVRDRLLAAGVDVEVVENERGVAGGESDPLTGVRDGTYDLALVGIRALRGSAADDLTTVAVLPREETRDVLVSLDGGSSRALAALEPGTRVGAPDARCAAFLRAHRPDVVPVAVGRDVDPAAFEPTEARYLVMGASSAREAGLTDRVTEMLDPKSWLPEPGRGALAIVAHHPISEATALDHLPTRTALRTELALLDALDARPDVPLGCLAQTSGRWIRFWAAAASTDGRRLVRADLTGPLDEPETLGATMARELEARGIALVLEAAAR